MKSVAVILLIVGVSIMVQCEEEFPEHGHSHPADVNGEHDSSFDHEAILGKEEEKEYAELPPEEAKRRLRLIAIKMDISNDGLVSNHELTNWVLSTFVSMDVADAKQRLSEFDTDQDQLVSWNEFRQNVYSYSEEDVNALKNDVGEDGKEVLDMLDEDYKKFNLADVNSDGKLDVEEYSAFEHPYNYPHMRDLEVERMVKEHDKDNDGFITFEEFKRPNDDPESDVYEKEQFTNLDKDKNAQLDRSEVVGWVSPDNGEAAAEEAKHLIKHADMDDDGMLSIDEIVNEHELFVGSQATDYGKDLHRDEL